MDPYAACIHWTRYNEIYFNRCVYCGISSKRASGSDAMLTVGYHDAGCETETCKGPACTAACEAVCEFCFLKHYDVIEERVDLGRCKQLTAMKRLPLHRNAKSAYNKPY